MFDIGSWEMLLIAVIALIVIGPKDLPGVLRTVGQWTRKARMLAREFQSGVDDMVREAELEDAKKALDNARSLNVRKAIEDTVDPTGAVNQEAKALAEATRETASGSDRSGQDKAAEPVSAANSDKGKSSDGEAGTEGATVVEQPVSIAPPHSITPPKEEAPRKEDAKTTEKTA